MSAFAFCIFSLLTFIEVLYWSISDFSFSNTSIWFFTSVIRVFCLSALSFPSAYNLHFSTARFFFISCNSVSSFILFEYSFSKSVFIFCMVFKRPLSDNCCLHIGQYDIGSFFIERYVFFPFIILVVNVSIWFWYKFIWLLRFSTIFNCLFLASAFWSVFKNDNSCCASDNSSCLSNVFRVSSFSLIKFSA